MRREVIQAVVNGDVAILHSDFYLSKDDVSGRRVESDQKEIEVLRRQADGAWRPQSDEDQRTAAPKVRIDLRQRRSSLRLWIDVSCGRW